MTQRHNHTVRVHLSSAKTKRHTLTVCPTTSLPRYRDRHQARQGAKALRDSTRKSSLSYSCSSCGGYHLEPRVDGPSPESSATAPNAAPDQQRYVLIDIENLTNGARDSRAQVAELWATIAGESLGLTADDHIVIGSSVGVYRKYAPTIQGNNVRWVVADSSPDGADSALLSAIDLHREASRRTELVIASGDGAFAPLASEARAAGLRVHVAVQWHPDRGIGLARKLAAAADRCTIMGTPALQLKPTPKHALERLRSARRLEDPNTTSTEGR